ncbi:MAG: xanthine dehydrogenase family protein subunit M [Acetobacteraceae bacterium]|nr:xanthine dehydrogenase family protein subunit M [Acetobacteraceae bacterium]
MQSFRLIQPDNIDAAITAGSANTTKFIAGGSDLLQLMKDNVETPAQLIDLEPLSLSAITADEKLLRLEAMARMSDVAAHPDVRKRWPVISEALLASASPQVRNMGTIGGNLLQRTRCGYFRDTGFPCNKRVPGSGCPAINGENRMLAILGVSDHCIASHASDLAVALVALNASVELRGPNGSRRTVPIGEFHRLPGDTPHLEANLAPDEIIAAVTVPATAAAQRSHYLKVRDRTSFEFALVSAAVAIEIGDGVVRDIGIAAGGVGTKPWRLPEVEAALNGKPVSEQTLRQAATQAGQDAQPQRQNAFKVELLRRTVFRALQTATA